MSWPLTEWAESLPGGWSNEAAEGEHIRPLLPVYPAEEGDGWTVLQAPHMSLGFVPFSEAQEDLLRLFTVTECAPGYRPAKHGRGRPVSSQKLNTSISQSDGQHRRSAWPQPRTPDCPRAWTCLKKKKRLIYRWCPRGQSWSLFPGGPHPQTIAGLSAVLMLCLELGLRWQVLESLVPGLNLSVRKIALLCDIHGE